MLRRKQVLAFLPIVQVACGSSDYWTRELSALGHELRLLNARHVKAFVKGNKNDFIYAEAIFDKVSRPNT